MCPPLCPSPPLYFPNFLLRDVLSLHGWRASCCIMLFASLLTWWIETFGALCTVWASHSLINTTVPSRYVLLMRRWLLLYQEASVGSLGKFCISQKSSSVAWQVHLPRWLSKCLILVSPITFPMRVVFHPSPWSKVRIFQRGQSSKQVGQDWAYFHSRPNVTWAQKPLPYT